VRLTPQLREGGSGPTRTSSPSARPRPGAPSSVAARSAAAVAASSSSSSSPPPPPATVVLKVEGMVCSKCTDRVENALMAMAGVEDARADFGTGEVKVEVAVERAAETSAAALAAAVEELGFGAAVA